MSFFKLLSGKIAKATKESGWYDIFNSQDVQIRPGIITMVPTGIKTEFSPDLRAKINEKSGRGLAGLTCHAGCIDADYRKEWFVLMSIIQPTYNACLNDYVNEKQRLMLESLETRGLIEIPKDTAVAQFKLEYVPNVWVDVSGDNAIYMESDMTRTGGFGSTEKHLEVMHVLDYVKKSKERSVPIESKDMTLTTLCKDHKFTFILQGRNNFDGTHAQLIEEHGSCVILDILISQ